MEQELNGPTRVYNQVRRAMQELDHPGLTLKEALEGLGLYLATVADLGGVPREYLAQRICTLPNAFASKEAADAVNDPVH